MKKITKNVTTGISLEHRLFVYLNDVKIFKKNGLDTSILDHRYQISDADRKEMDRYLDNPNKYRINNSSSYYEKIKE